MPTRQNLGLNVRFTGDASGVVTASTKGSTAVKKYGAGVTAAGNSSTRFARDTNVLTKSLSAARVQFLGAGNSATVLVSALAGGLGIAAGVRTIRDYSQEISTLGAVMGKSREEIASLEAETKRLGSTTRFTATQAAEGATFLARAGFNAQEVLSTLNGTLLLAQAGALDLARSADISSNVLKGFRLEADQMNEVLDVLSFAANNSNTNVEQLGSAMSYVAPNAAALGVSVQETAAAIGTLSDAGIQGERAGTALRQIFLKLEEAGGELSIETNGLASVMAELKEQQLGVVEASALVGSRQAAALQVLIQSSEEMGVFTEELNNAEGSLKATADAMDKNLNGAFLNLGAAAEGVVLQFADLGAEDLLTDGIFGAADLVRDFGNNLETVGTVAEGLLIVLGVKLTASLGKSAAAWLTTAGANRTAVAEIYRYQTALGTMTGASLTAIRAQTALAASTRVASAAFAAMGGVGGLVMLAASALLIFAANSKTAEENAEDLGLKIDALADKFNQLGEAQRLQAITQTSNAIGELTRQLTDLREERDRTQINIGLDGVTYGQTAEELIETNAAIEATEAKIAQLEETLKEFRKTDSELGELEYKKSLTDVEHAALDAAAGVTAFKDAVDGVGEDVVKLTDEQQELLDSVEPLRVETEKYAAKLEQLKDVARVRGLEVTADQMAELKKQFTLLFPATKSVADANKTYTSSLEKLLDSLDPVRKANKEYAAEAALLDKGLAKKNISEAEHVKLVKQLEKNYRLLRDPAAQHKETQAELLKELLPLKTAQEKYNEELLKTQAAFIALDTPAGDQVTALENLRQKYSELFPEIEANREQADALATAWEAASERIDSAFADAWKGAFDGFADFRDNLKDSFKTLLSELAHQAVTKPILISLGLAGGAAGGGGLLDQATGLLGGQSGAGGGGGFNLGSLFSQGGTISNVLTSGIGTILGASNLAISNGASALFQGLNSVGATGATNYLATGLANQTVLGNQVGNAVGIQGGGASVGLLTTAAAGYVGGYAGNALGEAAFGKVAESNYGQAAGGVAGAVIGAKIGTVAGPIGAAIGAALGALVDVAAGGDGKERVAIGVGTGEGTNFRHVIDDETGASGLRFRSINNRGGSEGAQAATTLFDGLLELDAALTTLVERGGGVVDLAGVQLGESSGQAGHPDDPQIFFGQFGFNGADNGDLSKSADNFVVQWLDQVNDQLSTRVREGLLAVDQTAEALVNSFEALSNIDVLIDLDVIGDIDAAVAELQDVPLTLLDSYNELTGATIDFANSLDGSYEAVVNLANGLADQKNAALQVALAYREVEAQIDGLFTSAIDEITEATLSDEEIYGRRRDTIEELFARLAETVDPQEISNLITQIDTNASQAFNLLDEGQQQELGGEFVEFLEAARARANDQVDEGLDTLGASEQELKSEIDLELSAQISDTQREASEQQIAAAQAQLEAAEAQREAAARVEEAVANLGTILSNANGNIGGFDYSSIADFIGEVNA